MDQAGLRTKLEAAIEAYQRKAAELNAYTDGAGQAARRIAVGDLIGGVDLTPSRLDELLADPAFVRLPPDLAVKLRAGINSSLGRFIAAKVEPVALEIRDEWERRLPSLEAEAAKLDAEFASACAAFGHALIGQPFTTRLQEASASLAQTLADHREHMNRLHPVLNGPQIGILGRLITWLSEAPRFPPIGFRRARLGRGASPFPRRGGFVVGGGLAAPKEPSPPRRFSLPNEKGIECLTYSGGFLATRRR